MKKILAILACGALIILASCQLKETQVESDSPSSEVVWVTTINGEILSWDNTLKGAVTSAYDTCGNDNYSITELWWTGGPLNANTWPFVAANNQPTDKQLGLNFHLDFGVVNPSLCS